MLLSYDEKALKRTLTRDKRIKSLVLQHPKRSSRMNEITEYEIKVRILPHRFATSYK